MKRAGILLFILFACVIAAPMWMAAQSQYTVTGLDNLGGSSFGWATGISNSGRIAGASFLPDGSAVHAVVWQNGLIADLGTLGGPNSEALWPPSDTGLVGGFAESSTPDPTGNNWCGAGNVCAPFLWQKGVMIPLSTLGGNNGTSNGMNNRRQVAGTAENATFDPTCPQFLEHKPVIWKNGKIKELPTFAGDPDGEAYTINDHGQLVGTSGDCFGYHHAMLWQDGKAIYLGSLGGTERQRAFVINNRGQVVGVSGLSGDALFHGFLWQNGVMTDLGALPGDVRSPALSINDGGQVVGAGFDAYGNQRACIWQNGGWIDLNTLIPADSPWYLLEADWINAQGQIVGAAFNLDSGEIHGFLATPTGTEMPAGAMRELAPRPKVFLPENVRRLLEQQGRFRRF